MSSYVILVSVSKVPSPRECGLPECFDKWRPGQEEALYSLRTSTHRASGLCASTGFGKSPLIVADANLSGESTCIVTMSKALQKQYMDLYESVGMVSLTGRSNYVCDLRPDYTCEEGRAARCPNIGTILCPSSQAEMRAATSKLVVTNYAKWTSAKKYGTGMTHFTRVVFDEAHEMPNAISSAMQVVLNHKEIEKDLKVDFLPRPESESMDNWKSWASCVRVMAEQEMLKAYAEIGESRDPKPIKVRHYTHMRNLSRRLATLALCNEKNWVVDETEAGYQFDPIRPGAYAESTLFLRVPRIICVSASLRLKTMFMSGMAQRLFDFNEFDSDFDPARCPIYYVPRVRVGKDSTPTDMAMLWMLHDQIAGKRQDRKGLVHTISYPRQGEILEASRFSQMMQYNKKGEPAADAVEEFFQSGPGSIFVSPSVGAGYDFKFDRAEWQFICKVPFLDSRSKIVKARENDDKEYGPYVAAQSLDQMSGRIMRDRADQGETFIADRHLDWFMPRWGYMITRSFHKRWRRIQTLPTPPPPLKLVA